MLPRPSIINPRNLREFCFHFYDAVDKSDMDSDLSTLDGLNRQLGVYYRRKHINYRLALNNIIIMYNVFGWFATELLYYKIDPKYHIILNSFLVYLGRIGDGEPIDQTVFERISEL